MTRKIKRGTTSFSQRIRIRDTSGNPLTGLVFNSAGLACYYFRDGSTGATAITLVTATLGTWTSGGFKEVDATNMPGVYELGVPNATLSTGTAAEIVVHGAATMADVAIQFELDAIDYQDAIRMGLTALPNAVASAANGLLTWGTSTGQLNVAGGKSPVVQLVAGDFANSAITAASVAASALDGKGDWLLSSGYTAPDSSADVWSYTGGRTLTSGVAQVVTPWQTGTITVIKGDSYLNSDLTELRATKIATATWPSNLLSAGDYTVTFTCTPTAKTLADVPAAAGFTTTGVVVSATVVRMGDWSAAVTGALTIPNGNGMNAYTYTLEAKRSSNTIVHTLEQGVMSVGA